MDIKAPISRDELGEDIVMSNIAVVNILSLITFLFNDYGICVPESQLARYWQHVRAFEPWGVNHPASASASHIPMAIYGDEC